MNQLAIPKFSAEQLNALLLPDPEAETMAITAKRLALEMTLLTTDADVLEAQTFLGEVSELRNAVEAKRVAAKAPVLELGRAIDDHVRHILEDLDYAQARTQAHLTGYAARQRRIIEEAEAAAQRALEQEAAAAAAARAQGLPMLAPVTAPITPELIAAITNPGIEIKTRKHTEYIITDEALIPREYMVADMGLIKAAWKAGKPVPGTAVKTERRAQK